MLIRPAVVGACFLPAGLGLLHQVGQPLPLPQRLLALALLLMLFEQAHMARVDLRQVAGARQQGYDPRLRRFTHILWATIAGEWVGFYLTAAGYLGLGAVVIVSSLLGFNLTSQVRFEANTLKPVGIRDRLDVIVIDLLALGLGLLWMLDLARLWVASILFGLTLIYGVAKLAAYVTVWLPRAFPSAIHIANSAQQHPQPSQQNR